MAAQLNNMDGVGANTQLPRITHGGLNPFFLGAPVSKAIAILSVLSFIFSEMFELHSVFQLDFDQLVLHGEIWRILTYQLSFETLGEVLFGLGLLCPLLRRFEREMSSRKFGTFLVFSSAISSVWEILLSYTISSSTCASGPYSLIGSFMYLFHMYTPRMYPKFFGLLSFSFSEKAIIYGLAFQLCFSAGFATLTPVLSGIVAAFVCLTPALPIQKWELPNSFYAVMSRLGKPFVDDPTYSRNAQRRRMNNMNNMNNLNNLNNIGNGTTRQRLVPDNQFRFENHIFEAPTRPPPPQRPPPLPMTPPPSEEVVETLTSMGFERDAVLQVLQQCDNNVEVAANRLLNS